MEKGIKKGALVTGYAWEYGKRIYGHITCCLSGDRYGVQSKYGLREFYGISLRPVKPRKEGEK